MSTILVTPLLMGLLLGLVLQLGRLIVFRIGRLLRWPYDILVVTPILWVIGLEVSQRNLLSSVMFAAVFIFSSGILWQIWNRSRVVFKISLGLSVTDKTKKLVWWLTRKVTDSLFLGWAIFLGSATLPIAVEQLRIEGNNSIYLKYLGSYAHLLKFFEIQAVFNITVVVMVIWLVVHSRNILRSIELDSWVIENFIMRMKHKNSQ
jgi:hypothetical protein